MNKILKALHLSSTHLNDAKKKETLLKEDMRRK